MLLYFILFHPVLTLAVFPFYWLVHFILATKYKLKYDFLLFYFAGFTFTILGMPLTFFFLSFPFVWLQWLFVVISYLLLLVAGAFASIIYISRISIKIQK
ncbi:hypothetical protein [Leptospira ilyithenensis]|uniref:Uncharacterized protein n=1 Tax=Leptospira ilyithenensis TaxID=2484901 RepID=A0A4R9LT89_9LEPT|nr:hypothetical protein [Leptospira ilyithenensis]TGN11956.1 hypothetical protein EHS11_05465 [Leptospira ilyithenensis]